MNVAAVNEVTERSHTLSGHTLTVTAHYDCLGTAVSTDGPVPMVPKPFSYSVDQDVMAHIMNKHNASLADKMKNANAEVTWPNTGKRYEVLIKPAPSANDGDGTIWRKWKDTATNQITTFLQQYVTESIQVPTKQWADVSEVLPELNLRDVDIHEKGNISAITLIGMTRNVVVAKETILKSIEEFKAKAEREAQTISKTVKLSALKIKLFTMFSIQEELNKLTPEVQVSVTAETNEISFQGIRGEVSDSVVAMYGVLEEISTRTFKTSTNIFEFIQSAHDVVDAIFSSKSVKAICDVKDGKITIYGKVHQDIEDAFEILEKDIVSQPMLMDSNPKLRALQSEIGSDTLKKLNDSGHVNVHLDAANSQIHVTGFTDKVKDTVRHIDKFLDENVIVETLFTLSFLYVRYVSEKCGKELAEMHNRHPQVSISPS